MKLPSTKDIRLLNNYLLKQCENHFDKLSKQFDKQSWIELSSAILLGLLIFNRRRPGELERSVLTDLDTLVSINEDTLANHKLNEAEKRRVEVYSRFVVRGKLARSVPVLLHDSFKKYLTLVLRYSKEAGVHPDNPFIFAAPQGNTKNVIYKHLWATTLMRRYSVECGASDPECLRATSLRKHIATNSASLKLNTEDLQQLQGYLGHADKIHREYYRQPIAERNIINMGRVLLAAQSPDHLESERQEVPRNKDGPSSALADSLADGPSGLCENTSSDLTDSLAAGPSGLCENTSYSGSSSEYNPSSEDESSDDGTASLSTSPKHQPKRRQLLRLTPGLSTVKRTWSTPERSAARIIFASHLKEGRNPTQMEIGVAVYDCKELKGRSIPQIKMWLQNQRLRKTESMWNTPRRHSCKELYRKFIETYETSYPNPQQILFIFIYLLLT
ncbi:hypothetical protein JTB14_015928 [Gonioctena quinquepunctata]|nr:hypothetical protein JTB14_015928 [Gonioctena quinquepunctata]